MNNQEHIVAVVDPTCDAESTLDHVQQIIDRGGRATLMVLATPDAVAGISAFAQSEELTLPDAREIYMERLAAQYSEHFGHEAEAFLTAVDGSRYVFATAEAKAATVVAMPQRLTTRRGWRNSVAKSSVPVLIAPPKAA